MKEPQRQTVAAISTPPGMGGIGIVRLSGPAAISIAERVFRSHSGRRLGELKGYSGALGRIVDSQGDVDDAIAFVYRAPRSYTGEDVVELSSHGGVWIVQAVLRLCLEQGAAAAAPGEFTKRAFMNGKLALSDAEAVIDLIEAQGAAAMRAALAARDGVLSTRIEAIAATLLESSSHLAAWADYPEEDIEEVNDEALLATLTAQAADMEALLATWDSGKILREGAETAIVGRPNVGKSTLMNLLAGEQRSIVTAIPGTTRDIVEDSIRLGDCVLRLADTAGIRETDDPVESIGVERAKKRMDTADLILAVFDSSDELTDSDEALLALLSGKPCIAVVNKIDLPPRLDMARIRAAISTVVTVSAQSGTGRDDLERAVKEILRLDKLDPTAAMVATERQRRSLQEAQDSVREAADTLAAGMTMDAVSVSIDYALDKLLEITGRRASEAVVEQVFSRFCVGK